MAAGGDVLVVGSINVDLVIAAADLPAPGQTVSGGTFARHNGGKGANQAVAAGRLGAAVTLVGAVGDDEFGRAALGDLAAEGVDISRVKVLNGTATGVALIVVDERGENQIAVAPGANAALSGQMVEEELADFEPRPGSIVVSGFEVPDEAIRAAARFAAAHRLQLLISPAPARDLAPELAAGAPILLPNEHEVEALTGEREPADAARALAARTGAPVVVTVGPAGALLYDPRSARADVDRLPAPAVEAVDTTGAGDAFVGALAAGLAAGRPLREAAALAVRAASMSVTVAGAREGMPFRDSLD